MPDTVEYLTPTLDNYLKARMDDYSYACSLADADDGALAHRAKPELVPPTPSRKCSAVQDLQALPAKRAKLAGA
eukprot:5871549-Pyramimonas_sp.AAC.1